MKKSLKILMWMTLGAGLLILLAIGAFGWFIYSNLNKSVYNYTCREYNLDITTVFHNKEDSLQNALKPLGIMSNLWDYALSQENGVVDENLFTNQTRLMRYNNELMSICEKNPDIVLFDLFKDISNNNVPTPVRLRIEELKQSVTVTDHPEASAFLKIIAKGMADRLELQRQISNSIVTVSSTTVSPVNPNLKK